MVPFLGVCDTLGGPPAGHLAQKFRFLETFAAAFEGTQPLTDLVNYQSTGVD